MSNKKVRKNWTEIAVFSHHLKNNKVSHCDSEEQKMFSIAFFFSIYLLIFKVFFRFVAKVISWFIRFFINFLVTSLILVINGHWKI